MFKKIVSIGVLFVMVLSVTACSCSSCIKIPIEPPPGNINLPGKDGEQPPEKELEVKAYWKTLYQTAADWGYNGSLTDFIADLLDKDGDKDDEENADLSAYEIYFKYHPRYLHDEEQWISDLTEGKLGIVAMLNEPMPEIWEEVIDGSVFDFLANGIDITTIFGDVTEFTIGKDVTQIDIGKIWHCESLENIYVEEGNQAFISDNGVLYSKSYLTLYCWPRKKPVTAVRETVKYFAPFCFYYCDMPENFELPDNTVNIGDGAFIGTNLTKLHLKENVKTVGSSKYGSTAAFPSTLKEITISAPIIYQSFFNVHSLETIIFCEGVKQIRAQGSREKEHQMSLTATNIEFPSTLEAIGDVSFPVNMSVAHYTLPENVKFLDKYAFDDCYMILIEPGGVPGPPIPFERKYITEFECKNDYSKSYIDKMLPIWERTAFLGWDTAKMRDYARMPRS